MGGIGISLTLEPIDPPPGKKRSTPRALHTAITRSMLDQIWRRFGYGAFRYTVGEYLSGQRHDGGWIATPSELRWVFMDCAGCCNGSSEACWHWFEVSFVGFRNRWDKMAAGRGWRIADPARTLSSVWFGRGGYPLLARVHDPMCIPRFAPGQLDWNGSGPFYDEGSARPGLADLDEGMRQVAMHAAITGVCRCALCRELAPWPRTSPTEAVQAAWIALHEHGDLAAVARDVRTEVVAYSAWREAPAGPPSLQVLRDQLGERLAGPVPHPWEIAGMCAGLG